ncbi:glutathione S-transferase family protein [Rhizobium sp. RAF56]|uniref:glutathione S-transferase family protein n=1 Tax=Rhizobium sp. RAF56 TaxID=3233062 RepID=UPI003F9B3F2C
MTLTLYSHPLASFCHKVLIALYENGTPFRNVVVDLGDRKASAEFFALWTLGKIPVLRDDRRGQTVPETSIIIEYIEQHYAGQQALLPSDEAARLDVRLWDRIFDLYVQEPMQAIVADRRRSEGEKDPLAAAQAQATLRSAYELLEERLSGRTWIAADAFSMADCAAVPALFYAGIVAPFADDHPNLAAYFDRLVARASVQRTLAEARPYFALFPFKADIPARFLVDPA